MGQHSPTDTVVLGSGFTAARAMAADLVAQLERSLAEGELDLPSLPEVALRIRQALADEDVSNGEIARLLGTDPALAARVLRVANSAMFHRGTRAITSLAAAVHQLGHRMVRNVALSFAAQQVFMGYGNRSLRELVSAVWRHSIRTAVLAHMLTRTRTRDNPDEAFLAGLLHEVGKLYIFVRAKEQVETLAAEPAFHGVLAAWHPRIGQAVIDAWELPASLASAVGEHETCALAVPEPPTLTHVIAVANYLAEHSEAASSDPDYYANVPDLGALRSDKATFDWLIRAADVDVRVLMMAFDV